MAEAPRVLATFADTIGARVLEFRGEELARYRKINLMPGELQHGAIPGESFVLIDALGLKLAPVICADVLDEGTFDHVAHLGADLILAPYDGYDPKGPLFKETLTYKGDELVGMHTYDDAMLEALATKEAEIMQV